VLMVEVKVIIFVSGHMSIKCMLKTNRERRTNEKK